MRVTPSIQLRNFLQNANRLRAQGDKYQQEVTTGQKVNRLSDNAFAASQASKVTSVMSANDQFVASNGQLRSQLELTDITLQSIIQSVDTAQTLATQALSGTTTPDSRQAIATQVGGVR